MNRSIMKQLKRSMGRTFALLLAVLMLDGSVCAASADERELQKLYGDDWQKVAALQPGDSYISGDTM